MAGVVMQILDSILTKLGELIYAFAQSNLSGTSELGLTLKALQTALRTLSARASDVEDEIKYAEQSGRKKRKREVEEWLADVGSVKTEVAELVARAEAAGCIRRMISLGDATHLSEKVKNLVDQSRYFGNLVLNVAGSSIVRVAPDMMEEDQPEGTVEEYPIKKLLSIKRLLISTALEPCEKEIRAREGLRLYKSPNSASILTNVTTLVLQRCFSLEYSYLRDLKSLRKLKISLRGGGLPSVLLWCGFNITVVSS